VISSKQASQITKRIRRLRQAVIGDNQAEFARLLGIEENRWNNIERGSGLSMKLAILIRKKTGVSLEWLIFGEPDGSWPDKKLRQELVGDGSPPALRKKLSAGSSANSVE
jgi:transcriptional regulator with XRE-family HTH domain